MTLEESITPAMAHYMVRKWDSESVTSFCRSAHHFAEEILKRCPQLKPFADADYSTKYGDYIDFAETLISAARKIILMTKEV